MSGHRKPSRKRLSFKCSQRRPDGTRVHGSEPVLIWLTVYPSLASGKGKRPWCRLCALEQDLDTTVEAVARFYAWQGKIDRDAVEAELTALRDEQAMETDIEVAGVMSRHPGVFGEG